MSDDPNQQPAANSRGGVGPGRSPESRAVGYGNPPVEHRFKKGQSGNPRGRPRKPKAAPDLPLGSHGPSERLGSKLLLQEAYRPVVVREGDKVIELPAIQAVFRAMNVSAMKGNRLAQKMVAELVAGVEEEHRLLRTSFFETAATYKLNWEQEIARCRQLGLPVPSPVPHPDDIHIDVRTGTAKIEGPMTDDEKAEWDRHLARRAEAQKEVTYYATKYRRTRNPKMKELLLEGWLHEQRIFDIINDKLPSRYKLKLENRTYVEGASREGQTMTAAAKRNKR
jgi:hypothetical protein